MLVVVAITHSCDQRADLRRMFTLVSEVEGGLVLMGEIFKEHVDKEGTAIVQKRIARYNASADEPTEGMWEM